VARSTPHGSVHGSTDEHVQETFARNGGLFVSVVGGLVVVGLVVAWLLDTDSLPLWVPAVAVLGGVLIYASTVRPRVMVEGAELVLRNMLSTVRIPLATIEEIAVQQVLAVRAGERRYVCAGAGRTLRTVMKGSRMQKARTRASSLTGEYFPEIERGIDYGDYIETRVRELMRADRARRGISSVFSPEAEELRTRIRREWAWPEIALLAAAVAFVVVAFAVR
jgi:hypothetical protein